MIPDNILSFFIIYQFRRILSRGRLCYTRLAIITCVISLYSTISNQPVSGFIIVNNCRKKFLFTSLCTIYRPIRTRFILYNGTFSASLGGILSYLRWYFTYFISVAFLYMGSKIRCNNFSVEVLLNCSLCYIYYKM